MQRRELNKRRITSGSCRSFSEVPASPTVKFCSTAWKRAGIHFLVLAKRKAGTQVPAFPVVVNRLVGLRRNRERSSRKTVHAGPQHSLGRPETAQVNTKPGFLDFEIGTIAHTAKGARVCSIKSESAQLQTPPSGLPGHRQGNGVPAGATECRSDRCAKARKPIGPQPLTLGYFRLPASSTMVM